MQNLSTRQPSTWQHYRVRPNGSYVFNTPLNSSSKIGIRTQVGYVGPRLKPPPNGPEIVHDYSLNVQELSLENQSRYVYANGDVEWGLGDTLAPSVSGFTNVPAYDYTILYNRALDKLNGEIRGELNLTLDLAESGKTLKMLNAQNQILDYTNAFARRFGPIKAASKAWLMWQYGIKPTVQSLYNIADENIRIVMNKTKRYKERASEKWKPTHVGINSVFGYVQFPINEGNFKVSVTIGADLRTPEWDPLRFATLNPWSLAYELTPLSFVGDWFFNLGGYLENLETALVFNSRFRVGYYTRLMVGSVSVLLVDRGSNPLADLRSWNSVHQGKVRVTNIVRNKLLAYPLPEVPKFTADLGSSRLLSGAALLGGLLNSGGNPHKRISRGASDALERSVRDFRNERPAKVFKFPPTNYHL